MKKIVTATLLALGAMSAAQAQYYGELAYLGTTLKESSENYKTKPNALRLIAGYNLMENLSIEGMVAFGTNSAKDKNDEGLNGNATKVNNMVGLYIKPHVNVSKDLTVFARAGIARTALKGTQTEGSEPWKMKATKFSYGAGISYAVTPVVSINADYMHYFKKDGATLRGFTVGLGYKF